jgi:hypothetical protein
MAINAPANMDHVSMPLETIDVSDPWLHQGDVWKSYFECPWSRYLEPCC